MEDEDHDDLLQCTDDESMSESEDQCIPTEKQEEQILKHPPISTHSRLQFFLCKLLLIISSTLLVIIFPLYQESVNFKGDTYLIILFTTFTSLLVFLILLSLSKALLPSFKFVSIWKSPLPWTELLKISGLYTLSGFMVVYALDRKRVMCHLQDPIKGIILVFSLMNYFISCKKLMGLQRIFSTTTIIVGLFISVDYGLCDEFRCRGKERSHRVDDEGTWKWQAHSIWAGIYILGLSLFAGYYTLLDRYVVPNEMVPIETTVTTSLLTTISRLVSFQNTSQFLSETRPLNSSARHRNKHSFIYLNFWIHLVSLFFTIALFWVDIVPVIGKSENLNDFLNKTMLGIGCHFKMVTNSKPEVMQCGNVSLYGWLFIFVFCLFTSSSMAFLILTQSAVYTVATMCTSLPLVGIWWSLFKVTSVESGLLAWAPVVTGELICALLGLPIVLIGLILLCKSHLRDWQIVKLNSKPVDIPANFA